MIRFGFVLGAGLLCLALVQSVDGRSAATGKATPSDVLSLPLQQLGENDLTAVFQVKGKNYTFHNRVANLKGKSGKFHVGNTTNGRKVNANLKNGKVNNMSMIRKANGAEVKQKRVVKAKKRPTATRLGKARKAALTPKQDLDSEKAEVVRVVRRQGFQVIGFVIQTPTGTWIFWIVIALVDPGVANGATEVPSCGGDEDLEVRAIPSDSLPARLRAGLTLNAPALLSRRVELEMA